MVKSLVEKQSISAALRLGRAARVPNLVFLTDAVRAPNPTDICQRLPAGSIIILRDYDHADRTGLAENLRRVTRKQNQFLLIAGDPHLVRRVGADGLHLPEYQLERPPGLTSFGIVSAACHSHRALLKAERLGVDFALVSPVFKTDSHSGAASLGIHRLARLAAISKIPLVALGGINGKNAAQLAGINLLGIAAISAFSHA